MEYYIYMFLSFYLFGHPSCLLSEELVMDIYCSLILLVVISLIVVHYLDFVCVHIHPSRMHLAKTCILSILTFRQSKLNG
jgi:hypothetical protein